MSKQNITIFYFIIQRFLYPKLEVSLMFIHFHNYWYICSGIYHLMVYLFSAILYSFFLPSCIKYIDFFNFFLFAFQFRSYAFVFFSMYVYIYNKPMMSKLISISFLCWKDKDFSTCRFLQTSSPSWLPSYCILFLASFEIQTQILFWSCVLYFTTSFTSSLLSPIIFLL
jgi:hypothetical protein